jgi:2-polyprenyl-3-methyl-5-hydroxy-6-metoxy-1,4-benzoquinol methylase
MNRRLSFEISYIFNKAPWDTGISPKELMDFLEAARPGRALDLGCGTGTNAITMAQHGWEVAAIDISTIAIMRAKRKARKAGVKISFLQGDVTILDRYKDAYDFVLDIGCFHVLSIEQRKEYADSIDRLLKPSGTFLLYSWINTTENDLAFAPTEDEIVSNFQPSMELIQIDRGVDSNREHTSAWFALRKHAQ